MLLGSLENIGALAGLTKDMFDRCYDDWLDKAGPADRDLDQAGLDGNRQQTPDRSDYRRPEMAADCPALILKGAWQPHFENRRQSWRLRWQPAWRLIFSEAAIKARPSSCWLDRCVDRGEP